jgi:hypothetical protein
MAFDLTTLLGCSIGDQCLRRLSEYFEETPEPSERDIDLDGSYYLEFRRSGFSLLVTSADIVHSIHIHAEPDAEYAACEELPHGLTRETTQAHARKLFGPPSASGGPICAILPPERFIYWDRWQRENYFVHLTYSERDSIELITLFLIPPAKPSKTDDT